MPRFLPKVFCLLGFALALLINGASAQELGGVAGGESQVIGWPEPTSDAQPWTRWWWHGAAVDEANLTRLLEDYHSAGLGGVEITCLYGVKGEEQRDIEYESKRWIEVVTHAVNEATRLGMQVDLPPGSGWRIGGPSVQREDGNADVVVVRDEVAAGANFARNYHTARELRGSMPQAVVAYGPNDETINLTAQLDSEGKLSWLAPSSKDQAKKSVWKVYAIGMRLTGEAVKRAGLGGKGLNINPYSNRSVKRFLDHFGASVDKLPVEKIRASFHDSYEYEGSWSDDFLQQFKKRRGYALERHLPALLGEGDPEQATRVRCDYRETMSDLVLDSLIGPWIDWSHAKGHLARNQAHGSPGNWLDLYAVSDIPETESFGQLFRGDGKPVLFRFPSSAAHVAGRTLVSSETATWLGEHFTVDLNMVKQIADQQFLAGVNHVIYHGTAYSPTSAAWPGWVFYASTQLNPQNPQWRDFPALNQYITRCQSLLQAGRPDNGLLVYWPIHDVWSTTANRTGLRGLRQPLTVHNANSWLYRQPLGKAADWLDANGVAYDFVSDRQLEECYAESGNIKFQSGGEYRAVLVPHAHQMPAATLSKIRKLADDGIAVLFWKALPAVPPGVSNPDQKAQFAADREALNEAAVSDDLAKLLETTEVRRETFVAEHGLQFIRRKLGEGSCYFLCNSSDKMFDETISLSVPFATATLMDPVTGDIGLAETNGSQKVRVQLAPDETIFVRTFDGKVPGPAWQYDAIDVNPEAIEGPWSASFVAGGPALPADRFKLPRLEPWTTFAGELGTRFAGTVAYSTTFDAPSDSHGPYLLDLGHVADSARVFVNGKEVGVRFAPPYRLRINRLKPTGNDLRVEVSNVAANRIRDLDRRGVQWRIFHDINFVNIDYQPFDASEWPVREAGLLGPVTVRPLAETK